MNKYKYSLPILLLSSARIFAYDPYDHMHSMIDSMRHMSEEMNRAFDEMNRHMNESFSVMHHRMQDANSGWRISFDETDDAVILKIKEIATDSIHAAL